MADENGKDIVDEKSEETTTAAEEVVEKGEGVVDDAVDAVKDIGGSVVDKAGDAAAALGDSAEALADKGKELAGDAAEKGKEAVADAAGAVTGAAGAAADKVGDAFGSVKDAFDGDGNGDSGSVLKWLLPLLLLGLLLVLFYMFYSGPEVKNGNPAKLNVSNSSNSEAVGESAESSLNITAKDGKYKIAGVVQDEKTQADIVKEAEAVWGTGNVDASGVTVNANAKPFKDGWWDGFKGLLPDLKDWKDGSIGWAEGAISTAGELPGAIADKIKSLFGGWSLPVSIAGAEDAAKAANEKALEMLSNADSVEKVVEGLNAAIINFASGQSDVPADAKPILEKAAEILKNQQEGTVIEVGGHTDNVGNAESNMKLSAARADSVRKALVGLGVNEKMLSSKGYGDTAPKGENETEAGRFANRRIEYKISGSTAGSNATEPAP